MRMLAFAVCIALLIVGPAYAQLTSDVTFNMKTPFTVGNSTLPAGEYRIHELEPGVLELSNVKGMTSVVFQVESMESVTPFKQTELEFNQYGDRIVLKTIRVEGETTGFTSIAERVEQRHRATFKTFKKVLQPAKKVMRKM